MPHCWDLCFSYPPSFPKSQCRKTLCIVKGLHNHSLCNHRVSSSSWTPPTDCFALPTIYSTPHPGLTWKGPGAIFIYEGLLSCWCLTRNRGAGDRTEAKATRVRSLSLVGFLLGLENCVYQSSLKEVTLKPPLMLMYLILS